MKKVLKIITIISIVGTLSSCGGNKKEDNYGNTASDETTITEGKDNTYPLAERGKEIFEGKGTCATCHKLDSKIVGPSIQDIVKVYKEKNASIATFLNGEAEPIVDSTQFEVMKANFAITKTFTDEERKSLEEYFLSVVK